MNKQNVLVKHQYTEPASSVFHPDSLLDPSEIEDYINSIPFDPLSEEVSSLIPTILEHSTGYSYRDTHLNHPHHYNPQTMDLFVEFELITRSNFNNPYRS